MAGVIKVDRVQSDSNLAFNIAGANVAFMDASALRMVGSNISVNGTNIVTSGKIVTSSLPIGTVLQASSVTKNTAFSTSSTTYVDITDLSITLTPTSSSSKFLLLGSMFGGPDSSYSGFYTIFNRNGTKLSVSTVSTSASDTYPAYNATSSFYLNSTSLWTTIPLMYLDSPATTSPVTYKIQMALSNGSGTVYVNRRNSDTVVGGTSSLTVLEIAG